MNSENLSNIDSKNQDIRPSGKCSPASPEWRAYTMHYHLRVLDEYGVDGLYNNPQANHKPTGTYKDARWKF